MLYDDFDVVFGMHYLSFAIKVAKNFFFKGKQRGAIFKNCLWFEKNCVMQKLKIVVKKAFLISFLFLPFLMCKKTFSIW